MSTQSKIILITGASSGFGASAARALAEAGHTVYASMRDIGGRNAPQVASLAAWARQTGADALALELDVQSEPSVRPDDAATVGAYDRGPYAGFDESVAKGLASLAPADEDPDDVARAIVAVVDAPPGRRPFRVHVNTDPDGAHVVNAVADRVRAEFLRRAGLGDLLSAPAVGSGEGGS